MDNENNKNHPDLEKISKKVEEEVKTLYSSQEKIRLDPARRAKLEEIWNDTPWYEKFRFPLYTFAAATFGILLYIQQNPDQLFQLQKETLIQPAANRSEISDAFADLPPAKDLRQNSRSLDKNFDEVASVGESYQQIGTLKPTASKTSENRASDLKKTTAIAKNDKTSRDSEIEARQEQALAYQEPVISLPLSSSASSPSLSSPSGGAGLMASGTTIASRKGTSASPKKKPTRVAEMELEADSELKEKKIAIADKGYGGKSRRRVAAKSKARKKISRKSNSRGKSSPPAAPANSMADSFNRKPQDSQLSRIKITSLSGELSRGEIQGLLEENMGAFRSCHVKYPPHKPGSYQLSFRVVIPSGADRIVEIAETEAVKYRKNQKAIDCLVSVIESLNFRPNLKKSSTVSFTISF